MTDYTKAVIYCVARDSSLRPDVEGYCSVEYAGGVTEFYNSADFVSLGLWGENLKKYSYDNLRATAEELGWKIAEEVIVCESSNTPIRPGLRKAIQLALDNDIGYILVANYKLIAASKVTYNKIQSGLELLGIRLVAGKAEAQQWAEGH